MPRALADTLKKFTPGSIDDAVREAKDFARRRPDVGWPMHNILDEIRRRWLPYDEVIPSDEFERVRDTVCPRMLTILRKLSEVAGYDPTADVDELTQAYEALKNTPQTLGP